MFVHLYLVRDEICISRTKKCYFNNFDDMNIEKLFDMFIYLVVYSFICWTELFVMRYVLLPFLCLLQTIILYS